MANNISFIATNGGHGAKVNLGRFTGLNINLAGLNTVTVDAAHNRMTLGPGATLGDMASAVFAAGKEIRMYSHLLGHDLPIPLAYTIMQYPVLAALLRSGVMASCAASLKYSDLVQLTSTQFLAQG